MDGRGRGLWGWDRRRLARVALLALGAGLAGCGPASHAAPRATGGESGTVPVLRVVDGDTIHVLFEGSDERVRFIGMDTPEVSTYGGKAECFGTEASRYTESRLSGQRVRLVFDVAPRDRYGRLLAYVYLGDELFNLTLVRAGFATADPVPPDLRMAAAFQGAEEQARAAGRGLWSACFAPP